MKDPVKNIQALEDSRRVHPALHDALAELDPRPSIPGCLLAIAGVAVDLAISADVSKENLLAAMTKVMGEYYDFFRKESSLSALPLRGLESGRIH